MCVLVIGILLSVSLLFTALPDTLNGQIAPSTPATDVLEPWPRFRGPSASGTTPGDGPLPVQMRPSHAEWKTALPTGHSSPVWWGAKLFLTGYDDDANKFEVLGLDRVTGKILWRSAIPFEKLQSHHPISNPAVSTPTVDTDHVYVYFASAGLFAFDHDGKPVWSLPLPTPEVRYGSATSPILSGDHVILVTGGGQEPVLLAASRETGQIVWKVPGGKPSAYGSRSTPLLWNNQIVVHSWGQVQGFRATTGKRLWWLNLATQGSSSPFSSGDTVVASTWSFGEEDLYPPLPSFDELLKRADKEAEGTISTSEFPKDVVLIRRLESEHIEAANIYVRPRFVDADKSGSIDRGEWGAFLARRSRPLRRRHGLIALRPGQEGEMPQTAVLWRESRGVSEVPTPVLYRSKVFMVTNGGIVTCVEPASGMLIYRGRLGAGSPYYASPVASGGHIYFSSSEGVITVVRDGPKLEVVARSDLGEDIYATPALATGRIYVRTTGHLYSFRK